MGTTMVGTNPAASSITGIAFTVPSEIGVSRYQRPSLELKFNTYDWPFTSNRNSFPTSLLFGSRRRPAASLQLIQAVNYQLSAIS